MTTPAPTRRLPHRSEARLEALRHARDVIDRAYDEPIDLAELARAAGLSRFHFARSFADAYGETPGRALTRRRLERAQELLRAANLSVTEICLLVGFSSLGTFSRRFCELVGSSPSAYRAEAAGRGGPPPIPGCFLLMWAGPSRMPPRDPPTASPEKRAGRRPR